MYKVLRGSRGGANAALRDEPKRHQALKTLSVISGHPGVRSAPADSVTLSDCSRTSGSSAGHVSGAEEFLCERSNELHFCLAEPLIPSTGGEVS